MGIVSGIVVFVILWWLVLFMVLPWKVRPVDHPETGHAESAPEKPRITFKFVTTTAITAVLWLLFYMIVQSGWVSFRSV